VAKLSNTLHINFSISIKIGQHLLKLSKIYFDFGVSMLHSVVMEI